MICGRWRGGIDEGELARSPSNGVVMVPPTVSLRPARSELIHNAICQNFASNISSKSKTQYFKVMRHLFPEMSIKRINKN